MKLFQKFNEKLDDLTIEDIQNLISDQIEESDTLDYKVDVPDKNRYHNDQAKAHAELAKDITGLANTKGGYLIYGLSEDNKIPREIVGANKKVGNENLEDWIVKIMTNGNVEPKILFYYKVIPIPKKENKVVLVLEIPESLNKPHMVKYAGQNCYYRRHGASTEKADHREVSNMFEYKNNQLNIYNEAIQKLNLHEDSTNAALTPIAIRYNVIVNDNHLNFFVFFIPYNLNRRINFLRDQGVNEFVTNTKFYKDILTNNQPHNSQFGVTYRPNIYSEKSLERYTHFYKNGILEWFQTRYLIAFDSLAYNDN